MRPELSAKQGVPLGSEAEEARRRVRQVYAFLRAFSERRSPTVRTLAEVTRKLRLRDLPDHPAVKMGAVTLHPGPVAASGGRASAASAADDENEVRSAEPLIRITRPSLTKAPPPPDILNGWVLRGWEKPEGKVAVWDMRNPVGRNSSSRTATERCADDPARAKALSSWSRAWKQWASVERPARQAMRVFEMLYALHSDIERQGERIELVLGDGRLCWQTPEGLIDHPVLLQRVDLVFDPDVPEFRVVDSDRAPELLAPLLLAGDTLSGEKLNELQQELEMGGYHPLANEETSAFLRRVVSLLGPSGVLRADVPEAPTDGPVIVRDAWLFARNRGAGFAAAFDRVLEDIDDRHAAPPAALTRIVGIDNRSEAGTNPRITPELLAQRAADTGETDDILLSKPANAEQIEIVRTLERHQSVVVQGPPGTGKSHTIANLVGHLMAQGKRVLVTSYTTKALRVLREHLVEELRPLCVALLDNDLEGRTQMEQAVRGIVQRLATSTEERLSSEVDSLEAERDKLIAEVERTRGDLRGARRQEYLPIEVVGEKVSPADAARHVDQQGHKLGWIPGPLPPLTALPLTDAELRDLYETNDLVRSDDERELSLRLPARTELPSPDELEADIALIRSTRRVDSERFWKTPAELADTTPLETVSRAIDQLVRDIAALAPWQRQLVAAGRTGGAEEALWQQLGEQVKQATTRWQQARSPLLEHAPTIDCALPPKEIREVLAEVHGHVSRGGGVSRLSMLFRAKWTTVLDGCRVGDAPPRETAHFTALHLLAQLYEGRAELAQRWSRQAEPAGLPPFSALPDPPEPTLTDYVAQFDPLLGLWPQRWRRIEAQLAALGFAWADFRAGEIAKAAPSSPFESDLAILAGGLRMAIDRRLEAVGRLDALRRLKALASFLEAYEPRVCHLLAHAVAELDPHRYRRDYGRLEETWNQVAALARRRELLHRLTESAPGWANAVENRRGMHGAPVPPRDLAAAWRYRQLEEELERRSTLDERAAAARLESQLRQLRRVTVELVDRKAWLGQLQRTGLEARQALIGWADTQRKIGKGTGKRAPALRIKARELLTRAREAVPVWIMPLSRVAESFDPRQERFDVVIIDEASQCDLTGLLAFYLGKQAAIVGDHEQVSPSAIGETVEDSDALISQYLAGIPNSHLYDGQTSVYDLARQSFGRTIGLREHFRCVPDIIEFSNHLSYQGEIRPLRDPNTARRPHVVEYQVPQALQPGRHGKVNEAEARAVAALVAAAIQSPEYQGKTFGAISLLGDEQAVRIQELVQVLLPLDELERRRFVAGNPAQFQGDERDIVFLSMVDAPVGEVLPLQERTTFKQRYNVAASRARDQLWLVHSLDPRRDLQTEDLRRRLVEHTRNPGALRKAASQGRQRSESPFEQDVQERLAAAGFQVEAQVEVGGYRIDMVVSDGRRQVAVECDGDRFHALDRIDEDMARQAVLERVGWRFIRIRSTRYFRDPDGVMAWVEKELRRLGVEPTAEGETTRRSDAASEALESKVIRRAWQTMREHHWVPDPVTDVDLLPGPPANVPPPISVDTDQETTDASGDAADLGAEAVGATVAELVLDDTTEPSFVILAQDEEPPRQEEEPD